MHVRIALQIVCLTALFILGCSQPHCTDVPTPAPEVDTSTAPDVALQSFMDISNPAFPNLFCVSFVDSLHGYMGGSAGFVSKTTNGGATWTDVSVASTQDIYGIYFINQNEGFASGNNGDFFKTSNAGASWTKLTTPNSSNNYNQIHFFDPLNGIAGGGTLSRTASFMRTTDGGDTWTDVSASVPGMSTIYDIEFIDKRTGYICGYDNNIYKTTDGGVTWIYQPVTITTPAINTISLQEIEFVSTTVGYCVGFSISLDKNFIFKTTNGGDTWDQLPSPPQTTTTADIYASFFAANADEIYIEGGNAEDNTSTLLKSTDGGISWSNVSPIAHRLSGATYIQNTSYSVGLNGTIIKSRN